MIEQSSALNQYCEIKKRESLRVVKWEELNRVSLLGHGQYAKVHHMIEKSTSRQQFAVKSLRESLADSSSEFRTATSDIVSEAAILSQLNHENIITLRGVSSTELEKVIESTEQRSTATSEDQKFCLLFDILHETLQDRLKRWRHSYQSGRGRRKKPIMGKLLRRIRFQNTPTAVDRRDMCIRMETVALGICHAMKYLHEQNILLRDLKPANVGFDEAGKVKLFDFGFARNIDDCSCDEVAGTPRYLAPEIFAGEGYTYASDVYSFGILLYEICSLEVPTAHLEQDFDSYHRNVKPCDARPSLESIPCEMTRALIEACWDKEPAKRPSFAAIEGRLRKIIVKGKLEKPKASQLSKGFHRSQSHSQSVFEDDDSVRSIRSTASAV